MCYGRAGWHRNRFEQQGWGAGRFGNQAPANIEEHENSYAILVHAPGLQKEGFKVSVKDDVLTAAYQPAGNTGSAGHYTRREYHNEPFERSFALNGKVETTQIQASYQEGILHIVLPKNAQSKQPPQQIAVG